MKTLFEAFEVYLQGLINTAISGVLSRLDRLEEKEASAGVTKEELKEALDAYDPLDVIENDSYRFTRLVEDAVDTSNFVTNEELRGEVKDIISDMSFEVRVR